MTRNRMRRLGLLGAAGVAMWTLLAAAPALAQHSGHDMANMPGMANMAKTPAIGQHDMPATVVAVDRKTGLLDVLSEGYKLRLHFPPAALAGVKKGDRITLHLGFSKP